MTTRSCARTTDGCTTAAVSASVSRRRQVSHHRRTRGSRCSASASAMASCSRPSATLRARRPSTSPSGTSPASASTTTCRSWCNACGPRIVENFLDMAHFPFVHAGVLGAESHTEVRDYTVTAKEDGIEVTNCLFWQPAATPGSTSGADVEYRYRVPHPYVATLSKLPRDGAAGFSLMIMASPLDEEHCRTWMIGAFTRSRRQHRGLPGLQPPDLRPGRADPRIATTAAAPARPDRRVGAEGRSRLVRLPPLARRPRAAVRHHSAFPGHAGRCWPLLGWRLVARIR